MRHEAKAGYGTLGSISLSGVVRASYFCVLYSLSVSAVCLHNSIHARRGGVLPGLTRECILVCFGVVCITNPGSTMEL